MLVGGFTGTCSRRSARSGVRAARAMVAVCCLALAASLCVLPAPAAAGVPPAPDEAPFGLADLLALPGDQIVTVPDGTYDGVSVDMARPETGGPLRGWLVLQAETRHGVVVRGDLELESPTSRVLFVGFRFENARVFNRGEHIAYWYTDHVHPDVDWYAAGRPVPRQFFIRGPAADVSVLGSDLHDGVASVVTVSGAERVELAGIRIWDLSEPSGSDPEDLSHLNTISLVGGDVTDLVVHDSTISGARANHQTDHGDVVGLRYENVWYQGGWGSAFQFNSTQGNRIIDGARVDVRSWGHLGDNPQDRLDIVDGQRVESGSRPDQVDVVDAGLVLEAPDADAVDPATAWRAEHPYDSWLEHFEWTAVEAVAAADALPSPDESSTVAVTIGATSVAAGVVGGALAVVIWRRRRRLRASSTA